MLGHRIIEEETKDENIIVKTNWLDELQIVTTAEEWEDISRRTSPRQLTLLCREYSWTIQSRCFITPIIQQQYNCDITPNCWRNCGESRANHIHILYSCTVLNHFWTEVYKVLDDMLEHSRSLNPEHMFLGRTPHTLVLQNDKYLFRILRITALKQMTRNWLKPLAPQISNWEETINEIYSMVNDNS